MRNKSKDSLSPPKPPSFFLSSLVLGDETREITGRKKKNQQSSKDQLHINVI